MTPSHPPKPRFALTIGVTGHRPNRLQQSARARVEQSVRDVLAAIWKDASEAHARTCGFFSESAPVFTLVTALAEGADIMAARAALAAGYRLDAVLPFLAAEYEKDFSESERENFSALCEAAHARFELDGNRSDSPKAYEASGLVVLDVSDILIAIWDGKPAAGRGSTVDTVHEAARRGMPIIHIDAEGASATRIFWSGLDNRHMRIAHMEDYPAGLLTDHLPAIVEALVGPPRSQSERASYRRYLGEKSNARAVRFEFPLLMALFGIRAPRRSDFRAPQPAQLTGHLEGHADTSEVLTDAYGWADAVATRHAQAFRGAFISNFLVSALATIAAVALTDPPWTALEIALVFILVVNTTVGQRRYWHHRWIEAREVAERLRIAAAMHAIWTRSFGHFGEASTWTGWYARAKLREAGLRSGSLDASHLEAARQSLLAPLRDQRDYHAQSCRQFQRLHHRLATLGKYLFLAALTLAAGQFIVQGFHLVAETPAMKRWLVIASTCFTALGAAGYGIRVIGDFDGAARRSDRMKAKLEALLSTLAKASRSFASLRDIVHHAADVMVGDVERWRLVVESRDLEIPG
ncbi:MAG TPA: hypothetical protein VII49_11085 [Rhizomicrobium sp.]